MFLIGKKNNLLNHLGIAYGYIYLEDHDPFFVVDIATGTGALDSLVQTGQISREEADEIVAQMRTGGVMENLQAVYDHVGKIEVDAGFAPSYHFVLHQCGLPIPHGYIKGEDKKSEVFGSFLDGLNLVHTGVSAQSSSLHVLDGVNLLKEMVAAGLPLTDDDAKAKYAALPQETKQALEQGALDDLMRGLGGAGVMVFEIKLPKRRQSSAQ
jgi:hypothetical protein